MILNNTNNQFINSLLKKFLNGEKRDSINQLENYIRNNPKDTKALYNLGVMYQETNNADKAIEKYLKVIKKDKNNWQSLTNLGLQYFKKRMYKESNRYHYALLKIKNNYQPALRDIGTNHLMLNEYQTAIDFLNRSIKLNPVDYICLNALGVTKMRLDKAEEAKILFEKAIDINKDYYTSYNNLGLYYDRIGNKEEAFIQYKKCLKIEPNYPNALNNIGLIYFYYEENEKAFSCFYKALEIDPHMVDLYFNLGHTYFKLKDFKKAEVWFDKGFKIDPNNINGHYNYAFLLLSLQQYDRAWIEYDYRLKRSSIINDKLNYEDIKNKIWNGEKLNNEKILVLREQGVGDEILYSSMYQELNHFNQNVYFESDPRLLSLFNRSFKIKLYPVNTFSKNKKKLKNFDKIIFAGSLGKIFRKKINNFSKKNSYILTNKKIVEDIQLRLNQINNKPKVGISWFSKNKRIGGGKSIKLQELLPILELKEVSYLNMQYDNRKEEIKELKEQTGIEIIELDDIDKFNDFESLAALIDSLDLFITVSNTTAHLSGAIGKETWVMAPKNDSLLFYWNTGETKTPWYPKVKIYPKINKWEETIKEVKLDLIKWINNF